MMKRMMVLTFAFAAFAAFAEPVKVSILGDSYSTFEGALTPEKNKPYYLKPPKARGGVESADQTWWMQVIKGMGGELEVNNSYSGSTICFTGYNKLDFSKTSFVRRAAELGNPDVIFICGGTNDAWAKSPLGEFKYEDITDEDCKSFRPACAKMFADLKTKYPKARLYFILNSEIGSGVPKSVVEIAKRCEVPVIKLGKSIEKKSGHPTAAGMKAIADAVLAAVKK
jgi:hypothetical protein